MENPLENKSTVNRSTQPQQGNAAWLAQLGERRTAVREVESSIPAGPTLRVLKLTEKNMLPFSTSRNG